MGLGPVGVWGDTPQNGFLPRHWGILPQCRGSLLTQDWGRMPRPLRQSAGQFSTTTAVRTTESSFIAVLSDYNKAAGVLKASRITGSPGAPALNTVGGTINVVSRGGPPTINQPGPKPNIDAGDSRFSGNVVQQQIPGRTNPSLWGVHGVDIGGRAAIEWYEIDASTSTLLQSGTIADPSLAFNYPSIAVNDFGDVVIGFSGGDPNTFMSTYFAAGQTVAGVTTLGPVTLTKAGVADYQRLDSNTPQRNRWGDTVPRWSIRRTRGIFGHFGNGPVQRTFGRSRLRRSSFPSHPP